MELHDSRVSIGSRRPGYEDKISKNLRNPTENREVSEYGLRLAELRDGQT